MSDLTSPTIGRYAKALVYIVTAGLVVLGAAITDDRVSTAELVNIGIAVITAVGVYLVPNLDAGMQRYAKGGVAFVGAALAALLSLLSDGITNAEWILVTLAALGAIGVVIVPNTPGRHAAAVDPA